MIHNFSINLEGKELRYEIGKLATQATNSVLCSIGNTKILSTLCIGEEVENLPIGEEFAPLTCEYRERSAAAGKIPGGFFKREGRPTDNEILISRLIDRSVRPLLPKGYFYDTQIINLVLSADNIPSDILAINASALVVLLSPIQPKKPLAAVRVCKINGNLAINPSMNELKNCTLNIVIAGTEDGIIMLEGQTYEVSENELLSALEYGYKYILQIIAFHEKILSQLQIINKDSNIKLVEIDKNLLEKIKTKYFDNLKKAFEQSKKKERNEALDRLKHTIIQEILTEQPEYNTRVLSLTMQKLEREIFEDLVKSDKRFDGRALDHLREISCEVGLLPRTHGSALFIRGETQALATVTLGTKLDQQIMEDLYEEYKERFLVHYNFLPFSVGEIKPLRSPSRREIGHGALAQKSLEFTIPDENVLPHTIRVVSDILSSNGSSSMATVCAGSLALMDAGVPIKKHIAGVALGLITINNNQYVLTDIIGAEDRYGEMDFKISGSRDGITAIQLDVKNNGLKLALVKNAVEQAKNARLKIIDVMEKCINTPRSKISSFAPQIKKISIPQDKIGLIIGPGGKTIRQIQEATGSQLEIDAEKNELYISAPDEKHVNDAVATITELIEDLKEGKIYKVKVKAIKDFGALVETLSGADGMIHVSEITTGYVKRVDEYLSVGQVVEAILIGKDESGRGRFSIKQLPK